MYTKFISIQGVCETLINIYLILKNQQKIYSVSQMSSPRKDIIMTAIGKLLIILLCALFHFEYSTINIKNVAFFLIALIISCLPLVIRTDLFDKKGLRIAISLIWSGFLIASIHFPELRFYLPVILMDVFAYKLYLAGILNLICQFLQLYVGWQIVLLSLIALFLQYIIQKIEILSSDIKKLRDTSKEHELLIEEKNRRLIEKQDAEIYTATLKERNRIAREIHDNVGHMLTRSILQAGAIKTINKNEVLAEPLEGLHETLNTAMTNIRTSVHDLHDESVDLQAAIREIIDPVENVSINLDYDMNIHVPKNIKYCFISITKEAVNNMLKHSNATQMTISMQEHPAFYQLLIYDNGTTANINHTDGIGLSNMKDRVKSLNGNIKITADQGFKILISIIKE